VQLPFIKLFSPGAKIVPVSLSDYSPETCKELGLAAAGAAESTGLSAEPLSWPLPT